MTSKKTLDFLPRAPGAPAKTRHHKMRGDACSQVKKCLLWDLVSSQYSVGRHCATPATQQVSPAVGLGAPVKVKASSNKAAVNSKRQLQFQRQTRTTQTNTGPFQDHHILQKGMTLTSCFIIGLKYYPGFLHPFKKRSLKVRPIYWERESVDYAQAGQPDIISPHPLHCMDNCYGIGNSITPGHRIENEFPLPFKAISLNFEQQILCQRFDPDIAHMVQIQVHAPPFGQIYELNIL